MAYASCVLMGWAVNIVPILNTVLPRDKVVMGASTMIEILGAFA